ncbi:MAG: uroporphyrinogen-III synthase, partial [Pseudomonadota bacterium]
GSDGLDLLKHTPLFVPHTRILEEARLLGLQRVVPTAPGDAGLLAGLIAYFSAAEPDQRKPTRDRN